MELITQRDPAVPLRTACEALGVPRATAYRSLRPSSRRARKPRPPSPRRLDETERAEVLTTLHSERFADQPVRQVFAELLDDGVYLASVRTMYRFLAAAGETRERRNQRPRQPRPVPRLSARRPNEVWTWDITKLPTVLSGVFLSLYVVLDLFSRYAVAWMVAEHENSALAKQLLGEAISRYGIEPGSLIVHNDRGAPMTALGFTDLLASLGAEQSLSRPRVSNDNPFSEAQFRTLKYQPDYPGCFDGAGHARSWSGEFFDWYNDVHRHSGLALYTPADVFFGRVDELAGRRQHALDRVFEAHPERFVRGRPITHRPPVVVSINPIAPEPLVLTAEQFLEAGDEELESRAPLPSPSSTPYMSVPGVRPLLGVDVPTPVDLERS